MSAPALPRTMGLSLAEAIAKRWIREADTDIRDLTLSVRHIQSSSMRQQLNRARRRMEQAKSPWVVSVADEGKRRNRSIFAYCVLPWSDDLTEGLGVGAIVADTEGVSAVRPPVRFTPHALARAVQTLGRNRAALITEMQWVADTLLGQPPLAKTTTLLRRDDNGERQWVVEWDKQAEVHIVRTVIRDGAVGGRLAARKRALEKTGASVILTRSDGSRVFRFDQKEARP